MRTISLQSLPACIEEADRLADRLGIDFEIIDVHRFPDGELRITISDPASTTILYASLDHPNDKLISILLSAEALRRNGTKRIVLVALYLCYMRQDIAFHSREAISQKMLGQLLSDRFDRIVTVDAHLHRTHDIHEVFPGVEATNISAMPAIAAHLLTSSLDPRTLLFGPDEESRSWVGKLAYRLGMSFDVARKVRHDEHNVTVDVSGIDIKNRPILIVDDIVSTGGTLISCAQALRTNGAATIDAIITHALFSEPLAQAFIRAGIRSVKSTDSVKHFTNAIFLDDLLASTLREEFIDRDYQAQA